jgi:serine/threonine protein kinase
MDAPEDRNRFGDIALGMGLLNQEQLLAALQAQEAQRAADAKGTAARIGEILIAQHVLEHRDVQKVLLEQQKLRHKPASVKASARDVGDYEIMEVLGTGGMGSVFRAKEKSSGKIVALKVLSSRLASDAEFVARFEREVKAAGSLVHPHIVHALASGNDAGQPYMVMEFVDGPSLGKLMRDDGRLPEKRCFEIALDIAKALDHAHSAGIVHRDVKPDNVLLDKAGVARLTDFGLAKLLRDDLKLTQSGIALGTPHYISPEQVAANRYIDHRADQYSLGAMMFHMLTGQVPFDGPTNNDIMLRHLEDPLRDPRELRPHLSNAAVRIIFKLMAKKSAERYDSTAQLIEDLQRVLASKEPLYATRSTVGQPAPAENKKSGCMAVLFSLLLIVAFASFCI